MTATRSKLVLIGALVAALLVGAASAHAVTYYFVPNHVVGMSALQMPDGSVNTRFALSHISDRYAPTESCLAVILDTQTDAFAVTAVPAASCLARQGGAR